jgi:hypothetical protein
MFIRIITGADESHVKSLKQCIQSIIKHADNQVYLIVYDLGIKSKQHKQDIEFEISKLTFSEFRTFPFDKYPPYFNIQINAGEYAWKPAIIHTILHECNHSNEAIFWIDAGCTLTDSLTQLRKELQSNKIYTPISQGTIKRWTHPKTLEHFPGIDTTTQNRAAGVFACTYDPLSIQIVDEWYKYAMTKSIIAPPGSSRLNHRQDQSILSILITKYKLNNTINPSLINLKIHQDCDDINSK